MTDTDNKTDKRPILFAHSPCVDGFMSKAIFYMKYGEDLEYRKGIYGEDPNLDSIEGRDVLMVDFSFKKPVIEEMLKVAKSVTIIDHHASAENELKSLFDSGKLKGVFDMEHSGAVLAWNYCFLDKPVPKILEYVEDRDLWANKLENTEEVSAALFSHPYNLQAFIKLIEDDDIPSLVRDGIPLLRNKRKIMDDLIETFKRPLEIEGYTVPCVNTSQHYASDVAGKMCEDDPQVPFAICYWEDKNGKTFSLRSRASDAGGGMNVYKIAEKFGGGGHVNAAGFTLKAEDEKRIRFI